MGIFQIQPFLFTEIWKIYFSILRVFQVQDLAFYIREILLIQKLENMARFYFKQDLILTSGINHHMIIFKIICSIHGNF